MGLSILAPGLGGAIPASGVYPLATSIVLASRVTGDTNDRFQLLADGTEKWGPGNGATDTALARGGNGILDLTGTFRSTADVIAQRSTTAKTAIGAVGPGGESGLLLGSANDTNFYRSAADQARTDDALQSASDITAHVTDAFATRIGRVGPGGESGMIMGNTGDTRIYRSAASTLGTDSSFVLAGGANLTLTQGYINLTSTVNTQAGIYMTKTADIGVPGANRGVLYMRDDGGGKAQFVVRFNSGAVQVIATEP